MLKFIIVIELITLSSSAVANYDGNALFRLCEEAPAAAGMYLQGVMDGNDDHLVS
jgi:hypothetical protein